MKRLHNFRISLEWVLEPEFVQKLDITSKLPENDTKVHFLLKMALNV